MGAQRRVSRLLELPQVHQHQRVQPRRAGQYHAAGIDRLRRRPTRSARNAASRWCAGVRASASSSDARAIPIATASSALASEPVSTGVACPDCKEGDVLERRSRRGKIFYGCGRYPKCKFASWDRVVLAAVSRLRLDLSGREDHQARRHPLAMSEQGVRSSAAACRGPGGHGCARATRPAYRLAR